jgi:hypothetical protein
MIINRNNYEEYFLLYIDRELSAAERAAVEHFVTENPDLRPELEALQSVTLDGTDTISFPGKKELLSTGSLLSIVTAENRTEYFILYADNELSNEQKASVEQFVYHHPEHQQEFELFLQARIEADRTVIFEDKNSLYRKEATVRPISGWFKLSAAVAAAVIFLIFGYLQFNTENEAEQGGLYSKNVIKPAKQDTASGAKLVIPELKLPTEEKAAPELVIPEEKAPADAPVSIKHPEPKADQIQEAPETPKAARPLESAELTADMDMVAEVETDKVRSLHPANLQIVTPEAPEIADQAQDAELSIANIPVSEQSRLGRMIRKTSRFINRTTNRTPSIPGLVIGHIEIAVR